MKNKKSRFICLTPHRSTGPHDMSKYFGDVATGFHLKEYTNKELYSCNRSIKIDGLVKSRKTDFLPQHIGIIQYDDAICCGQNKVLGLFTRPSKKF